MKKIILTILLLFISINSWAVNYCNDSNTAGAWKFDESSGNFSDCTSNANTGIVTDVGSTTGVFGNAANFTNVNNANVNAGSNAVIDNIFDGGGTFSAEVALRSAGTSGIICTGGTIAAKGDNDGWTLCVNATGAVVFSYKWEFGRVNWTSTTTPFSAFDYSAKFVMVYYNSSSTSNVPNVYVGCSALTMTTGDTPLGTRNTDAALNLTFGLEGTSVDQGELDGSIDEALLYNGDLISNCASIRDNGIDGTHGSGGSGSSTTGKLINGAILNGFISL